MRIPRLVLTQLSDKLAELISKTGELMEKSGNQDLKSSLMKELSSSNSRKEVTIAFVGQYSAGKSTIISALTGNSNIKIDANVSTDIVSEYDWNGIKLIDTPGILAGKCEQHDDRTKEALKSSDLIAYVITSQLFDDVIFNNFIDLAYNQQLKDKMMIVVNKMSMEATESFDQLVANYTTSLSKIFEERGYVFDFTTVFVDAVDFIDGVADEDEDFIELSNFNALVVQMNLLTEQKGLLKKQFDTPVRILQSYLSDMAVSRVDPQLVSLIDQQSNMIKRFIRDIKQEIIIQLNKYENASVSDVMDLSRRIGEITETEFEDLLKELSQNVERYANDALSAISDSLSVLLSNLQREIGESSINEAIDVYINSIDVKISSGKFSIDEECNLNKQRKGLEYLKDVGIKIGNYAPKVTFFGGVSQASGSALHGAVKNVGHFLGYKFKPWEATKFASNLGKAAKFGIPALTAVLSIGLEIHAAKQEEKRRKQIETARQQFISESKKQVLSVRRDMEKEIMNCSVTRFSDKLNEMNQMKISLVSDIDKNDKMIAAVKGLNDEYSDFIKTVDFYSADIAQEV